MKAEKKVMSMVNPGSVLINHLPESVRERRPVHLLRSPPSELQRESVLFNETNAHLNIFMYCFSDKQTRLITTN